MACTEAALNVRNRVVELHASTRLTQMPIGFLHQRDKESIEKMQVDVLEVVRLNELGEEMPKERTFAGRETHVEFGQCRHDIDVIFEVQLAQAMLAEIAEKLEDRMSQ